jgi:hypothetical protein
MGMVGVLGRTQVRRVSVVKVRHSAFSHCGALFSPYRRADAGKGVGTGSAFAAVGTRFQRPLSRAILVRGGRRLHGAVAASEVARLELSP